MNRNEDTIKVLDGPLAEREPQTRVNAGLGDKKKVIILVVLALGGASVAGYQFLGGKSPQAATAETAVTPVAGAPMVDSASVDSALRQLEAKPQNAEEDTLSVAGVEELVRKFDTYVQDHQIPLGQLQVNPFEVVLPKPASPSETPTSALAAAAEESKPSDAQKKVHDMATRFTLGSLMLVGDKAMAVINGKLCRVGDRVGEFEVETIDAERVVLTCNGEKTELRLRPKAQAPEKV